MDARLTLLLCVAVLEATVRLTDAAAPPVFTKPSAAETKNVDENTPIGTVVYIVEATDGDSDTIIYTFHAGSEEGPLFAIDGSSGKVTVKAVLDFENLTVHSYKLKFVATAGSDAVDSVVVTVKIIDVNEAPVFPEDTITEANVNENSAGGTSVCTVTATDADTANTMAYSLTTDSDQLVDINSATGEVTVKDNAVLDHEAGSNTFNIQIVATDDGSPQKSVTSQVITVTIDNVNEAPVFPTSSATFDVLVGATDIGILPAATDPETDTITYPAITHQSITYSVDASTRAITASEAITYTNNNGAAIAFIAKDDSGAEGIYTLTLNVKTVPKFTKPLAAGNEQVDENTAVGTVVYTVEATDDDGDDITYSFNTDSEEGELFAIDGSSGIVTVKAVLDFEDLNDHSYDLKFVATDNGSPQQTATSGTITVTIKNVDEAPVFSTTSATVEVSEGATADIHTLPEATDPEGENVTYSVDEQNGITYTINSTTRSISADPAISLSNDGDKVLFKAIDQTSKTSTYTLTLNVKTGNEENGSVMLGVSTGLLLLMAACAAILA